MINITRIYSDDMGESHFEDIQIPLNDKGEIGFLSDEISVKKIIFREVIPAYDYDFHTAPQRQYLVLLDGRIEIETSLGVKRIFNGGEILLLEDTTGKGHKTKNLVQINRKSIFITI